MPLISRCSRRSTQKSGNARSEAQCHKASAGKLRAESDKALYSDWIKPVTLALQEKILQNNTFYTDNVDRTYCAVLKFMRIYVNISFPMPCIVYRQTGSRHTQERCCSRNSSRLWESHSANLPMPYMCLFSGSMK